jgi:hypothetical protein
MTTKTTNLGGTDWADGGVLYAADQNDTIKACGYVPIGAILPWAKTITGVPALLSTSFVECNGQTLSDAGSLLNGQVIPNLNGAAGGAALSDGQKYQRFLRGAATSGGSGGANQANLAHTHSANLPNNVLSSGASYGNNSGTLNTDSQLSATQSLLNPYYEIVWIMRVK